MNIFDFIKKIFFKEKQVDPVNMVNLNNLVRIPLRAELSEFNDIIDGLKDEYKNIIQLPDSLISVDNYLKDNRDKKNMYTDILRMLCSEEEREILMQEMHYDTPGYRTLNLIITSLKLKNYSYEVKAIEQDIILRLVALSEILSELMENRVETRGKIETFGHHRIRKYRQLTELQNTYKNISDEINIVKQMINHLSSSILVVENQNVAINLEIKAKLEKISHINTSFEEDEEVLLEEKLNSICSLAKSVIPDELEIILKKDIDVKLKIVLIECALEKYVFLNKSELEILNSNVASIALIDNYILKNLLNLVLIDKIKVDELLEKVSVLESKFKIFDFYGDNLVSREVLENLYLLKFNLIAKKIIIGQDVTFIDKDTNYAEMECYSNLVMSKIDYILNNYKAENRFLDIVSCVELLKDENGEYLPYKMLKDNIISRFLLRLIFRNLDRTAAFESFLDMKLKKSSFDNINFCDDIFDWDERISIRAILMLVPVSNVQDKWLSNLSEWYWESVRLNDEFKLPEGLIEMGSIYAWRSCRRLNHIDYSELIQFENLQDSSLKLLKLINKNASGKTLLLPSTMLYICGNPLKGAHFKDVILNDGLKGLNSWTFSDIKLRSLSIPSSLKYLDESVFDLSELCFLTFEDYENSHMLNFDDDTVEVNFFTRIFTCKKIRERTERLPKHIKDKQEAYRRGNLNSFCDSELLSRDKVYGMYKIESNLQEISLESIDGSTYKINPHNVEWYTESIIHYSLIERKLLFDLKRNRFKVISKEKDSDDNDKIYPFEQMIRLQIMKEAEKLKGKHKSLK